MNPVPNALAGLSCAGTIRFRNLAVIPLLSRRRRPRGYDTLEEAFARGTVTIEEVSGTGEVPRLRVVNRDERAVLLLDGEELVGAKQNRVLNVTVLAPGKADTLIPVSCVEAGRWGRVRPDFTTGGRTLYASARACKTGRVSESLRERGTRDADQGEVWDDIREKFRRLGGHSPTEAMADLYEDRNDEIDTTSRPSVCSRTRWARSSPSTVRSGDWNSSTTAAP